MQADITYSRCDNPPNRPGSVICLIKSTSGELLATSPPCANWQTARLEAERILHDSSTRSL